MEEIVNVFINNGAMVGCLVYFMYRDFKFMNLITTVLTSLQKTTENIEKMLERGVD